MSSKDQTQQPETEAQMLLLRIGVTRKNERGNPNVGCWFHSAGGKIMKRLAVLVCAFALLLWAGIRAGAQESSSSTQTTTTTTKKTTKKSATSSSKIDINSATKDELEALPGIGPATSQKIMDGRPYRAKSDLLKRKIVSASEYEKIKDEIVAHRTSATTK